MSPYFNPRTYVRCDVLAFCLTNRHQNFNPRTYVRCDGLIYEDVALDLQFQSTHLREVRLVVVVLAVVFILFQSTHLREVRPILKHIMLRQLQFQSTHLREVRPEIARCRRIPWLISIHAPTWGATYFMIAGVGTSLDFNPRTYVRCDVIQIYLIFSPCYFNPRTYVRCDHLST